MPSDGRSVVVCLGALGDFVLVLPLVRALKRQGSVALITRGCYRSLLRPPVQPDQFIDVDGPAGAQLFAPAANPVGAVGQVLQGAQIHLMMTRDETLADRLSRCGATRILWHTPRPGSPPHVARRYMATAGLPCPESFETQAVMPRTGSGKRLWIHPGSGSAAKTAPPEFFAEIASVWCSREGGRPLVSFGDADESIKPAVVSALLAREVRFEVVEQVGMGELSRMMESESALCVTNDTGVGHLAAALGVPTLSVFVSTDPAVWRPLGTVRVLEYRSVAQARDASTWRIISGMISKRSPMTA